jgi:peptidyl-prolyl cis-trans isomerase SurA
MSIVKSRSWLRIAAAVAAAGLAVSACGTVKLGAAAITGNNRISSTALTNEVANLNTAYSADKAKGVKPQRPVGQETQQVLTWLILFRVYDQIAARNNINITPAQAQRQLTQLTTQAAASKVSLTEFVSAGGALPPDLVPQLGQYFAILSELEGRIDGGKAPTTTAGQAKVQSAVAHDQCLASKDLGVSVNPQFGVWDYRSYSVVPAPPTLAAAPSPSAAATPALTKAPC